ncbi:uncharacterized protein LOC126829694 isoform X2 [Patella vulgata]|nr:uncharacterized protein LOC126829694 isoform X2 [Patella vulgata]
MVEGRCMYGFSVGYPYNAARILCESEGTQLVTLQSDAKQEAVWTALNGACNKWTEWYDRDNVSGTGDLETLTILREENPGQICEQPLAIDAQLLDGRPYTASGEIVTISPTTGLICKNKDQIDGICDDYRVRFCCDPSFNFDQHWMGLKKRRGIWQWNEDGVLIDVTSTRWENVQGSNNVAYTMSSQGIYLWKMTNTDSRYKPVCEEISDTSSSAIPVSHTETSTVAAPTTTPPVTKEMSVLYDRHLQTLNNVVVYKTVTAVNANHCAVRCLMFSQCRYFRLVVADGPNCDLMEVNSATGANYDCSVHKCYKRSLV